MLEIEKGDVALSVKMFKEWKEQNPEKAKDRNGNGASNNTTSKDSNKESSETMPTPQARTDKPAMCLPALQILCQLHASDARGYLVVKSQSQESMPMRGIAKFTDAMAHKLQDNHKSSKRLRPQVNVNFVLTHNGTHSAL